LVTLKQILAARLDDRDLEIEVNSNNQGVTLVNSSSSDKWCQTPRLSCATDGKSSYKSAIGRKEF